MKIRAVRGGRKPKAASRGEFAHSSKHEDLKAVISDHLLDAEAAAATAAWHPSRRGNSPRLPDARASRTH